MAGRLFLTMGTPGAGKSSFLRDHVKDPHTQVIVSRDVIRFRLIKEGEPISQKRMKCLMNSLSKLITFSLKI